MASEFYVPALGANFEDNLSANYAGYAGTLFGQVAHTIQLSGYKLTPYAQAALALAYTRDFSEKGAAAALSVDEKTTEGAITTLGLNASREFKVRDGSVFEINLGASWEHNTAGVPTKTNSFAGANTFTVAGNALPEDAFVAEAGLDWKAANGLNFEVNYEGTFSGAGESHSARIGFSKSF